MRHVVCILLLFSSCVSSKTKELSYRTHLLSYIQENFRHELAKKKVVYVVLVNNVEKRYNFFVYESFSFPDLGYLPVEFSRLDSGYVFFYDYRFKPLDKNDVTFPLHEGVGYFETGGSKMQHLFVEMKGGEFRPEIKDIDEGINLYLYNSKVFRHYSSNKRSIKSDSANTKDDEVWNID